MTQEVFEEEDIPVAEFENIGLSKDGRLDLGDHDLKALLAGRRTRHCSLAQSRRRGCQDHAP